MSELVPTWTYAQITDPQFLEQIAKGCGQLRGKVIIELHDGRIKVGVRMAIINLCSWNILNKLNIPICKRHWISYRAPSNDNLASAWSGYYDEIVATGRDNIEDFKAALWECISSIYVIANTELTEYAASIDAMSLISLLREPKIDAIVKKVNKSVKQGMGSNLIEKVINDNSNELLDAIVDNNFKVNPLYSYHLVSQLNRYQVPQTLLAFGVRTDINDSIINLPVTGSAVSGVKDVAEYAVESLSAKKSSAYNKNSVRESQYFGRKQHLTASTIKTIYRGDCGSTVTIDFNVNKMNYKNLYGSYILDNGKWVNLNKNNIEQYIGTTVKLRNAMCCRHRDGVCEMCGGLLTNNVHENIHIGILSAINAIEPITQKILSAKHLIKTASLIYKLDEYAKNAVMQISPTELKWNTINIPNIEEYTLGISVNSISSVHDVVLLEENINTNVENMSAIDEFVLLAPDGTRSTYTLNTEDQTPYLSHAMLLHMRDHYPEIRMDEEFIWIPLCGTKDKVIFNTIVVNDSMVLFVKNVENFLSNRIASYNTCSGALNAFSDIVHNKVSLNIAHMSILLKAYLITSANDYDTPIVTDPDNVMFGTTSKIVTNRQLGPALGFQYVSKQTRSANSFTTLKSCSVFDYFIGFLTKS